MKQVVQFMELVLRMFMNVADFLTEDNNAGSFVTRYKNSYHKK